MAKKFLNGYKQFSVEVKELNGALIGKFDFRMRYTAMREYYEAHFKQTTVKGGIIKRKFKYLYYFYVIDFSGAIEKDEGEKVKKIVNYELAGKIIILIPHIDVPGRYDEVITETSSGVTEKTEFSLAPQADYAKGNTGLILRYRSAKPWTQINWFDSEAITSLTVRVGKIIR